MTTILDRLLHHSHVLNIRGESYRLGDKRHSICSVGHLNTETDQVNGTRGSNLTWRKCTDQSWR